MQTRNSLLWIVAVILACLLAVPAIAQVPAPPVRQTVDANGVDLLYGTFNSSMTDVTIGPAGPHGLSYTRYWNGAGWRDSTIATISGSTSAPVISIGGASESFHSSGGVYTSDTGSGSTLYIESGSGDFVYTSTSGVVARFETSAGGAYGTVIANLGKITSMTFPDGTKWSFAYKGMSYCTYYTEVRNREVCGGYASVNRLQSVTNNLGYQLKFSYASNTLVNTSDLLTWLQLSRVTGVNNAVEYCDQHADSCSIASTWPHADYTSGLGTVTDSAGRIWTYSYNGSGKLSGIRRPTASSDDVVINYDGSGLVSSVVRAGGTWSYSFVDASGTRTTSITDPLSHTRVVTSDPSIFLVGSDQNENGSAYTSTFGYDGWGRLTSSVAPEGNRTELVYDSRGNVTMTIAHPKGEAAHTAGTPSSSDLATSSTYPSSCTASGVTIANCNKPVTSTDAAGNVTNYYWNADGSPNYVEAPAVGGVRARTSYSYYGPLQAWLKTSTGSFALSPDAVTLPKSTWSCRTSPTCAETSADAVKSTVAYYGGSTSSGTNMLAAYSTAGPGDGSAPTATTSYAYDNVGNVTSVTDPLGRVATTFYNAGREVTLAIGPDPDGAGSKRPRGVRIVRNGDGTELYRASGTVNADGSSFSDLQYVFTTYDAYARKASERLTDGATNFAMTQYSYDAVGRLDCTAVRMVPSTYPTLPDACTQTSGNPDRISKNVYEWAGALGIVKTGVGVSGLARDEVTYTHTLNGQTSVVTDAKGNATSYTYDGLDRPVRTCYNQASPTTCAGLTSGDFVQVNYGTSGNGTGRAVSRTVRGLGTGIAIGVSYDALGRVTNVDYPGSGLTDSDVTNQYDLLGRLTWSYDTNGHSATLGYDALGRVTSQGNAITSVSMGYDLAGRRTSYAWSPTFYITYDYDATDAVTTIKEVNGPTTGPTTTTLATFYYDDLGRRSALARGNGVNTTYGYDGGSRLTAMGLELAGGARNVNYGFSYNPAGQITQRTSSNDAYAWTQHYNVSRSYTANGLNQYSAVGSLTPTYDAKGNLTQAGSATYAYNTKNELVGTTATPTHFYFDPAGRLDTIMDASDNPKTAFLYDGDHISAELDPAASFAVLRRYVWGPGADEPLVWYEGPSNTDRRYLSADERGSVVAVTDGAGNATAINAYDDYGIPASTNLGRFQYTGQAWLPELGMYHYKARTYSPTLGRFMQTDPIGYGDGVNWYNYVGGDPVNGTDPSGLTTGSLINSGPGLCGSCTGSVTWYTLPEGLKREGETGGSSGASGTSGASGGGGGWYVWKDVYDDGSVKFRDPFYVSGPISSDAFGLSGGSRTESGDRTQNGDAQPGDIVVTGTRQQPGITSSPIILIGGPGFDSGLPRDPEQLEKMLADAKKAGDTKLSQRIIRQQKMLGVRNIDKLRGLGKFRIFDLFIITPVIQNELHNFNCMRGIDDGIPCNGA